MSETQIFNTVGFAAASSASRGAISVIDRLQFGIRRKKITSTNVHNNMAALVVGLSVAAAFGKLSGTLEQLMSLRVLVFAFLLQASANAFSYAFRHMKVPSIIVVTKSSDFLIAPLIFAFFGTWSMADFLFAACTSIGCLAILFSGSRQHIHLKSSLLICALLAAQGALSPWYMAGVSQNYGLWVPFTCALITWRLVYSVLLSYGSIREVHLSFLGHNSEYWYLHAVRAGLTLSAQAFQVLALSLDRPVIVWSILNATGLFAIVLSNLALKERASRREMAAILLIAALGALRVVI